MRVPLVGVLIAWVCAAPLTVFAQPTTPRVLYLSHAAGFPHDSRHYAGQVITALGQSSGAFTVNATDDVAQLSAANLATYDAVVFFTSGELPISAADKTALLDFVRSGKGFVGVHSATDTFYNWPEYGDLIGAYFQTHPWTQAATIRVEDRTHRSTAHLGASFVITDEIYQFRNWSRSNVNVLLSLDTTSVPPEGSRSDNDYALAWTKPYGAGRVFYTALGHPIGVWDDLRFREHVLQGILWALGDTVHDSDSDTLPDDWEVRYGLDLHSAAGANGASGDPDGDGATNAQEIAAHTHPNGLHQRYLAEGATGDFFDARIALVNPDPVNAAHVQLRFLVENGPVITNDVLMPPRSRRTVFVDDVPGMAHASFSTLVDSDHPVVADRTMSWIGSGAGMYGSHAETSVAGPSTEWYFAEGATSWRFDLYYLIQNPSQTQTAEVTASFLPTGAPASERPYTVPPNGRLTIHVDDIPGFEAADLAAAFRSTNTVPIIVERAMYLTRPEQFWAGGHAAAGVTSLSTRWFLAEGAEGDFFDTFVLLGNPNAQDAAVLVKYLLPTGQIITRPHIVPARSRLTLHHAAESPALAHATASTVVESTNGIPIVVERAMWWPGDGLSWYEGHSSVGTTETGTLWALADGEAGGPQNALTYVLVATGESTSADSLKLTVILDNGPAIERVYPNNLLPNQRLTFDIAAEFPAVVGRRFGVIVESLAATLSGDVWTTAPRMPMVVERAMYSDAPGLMWAAGSGVVGTKVQ